MVFVMNEPQINVHDARLIEKMFKNFPEKYDRCLKNDPMSYQLFMGQEANFEMRTDARYKEQRNMFVKELGVNSSSKYGPLFLELGNSLFKFQKGEEIDFLKLLKDAAFDIFAKIFFGEEIFQFIKEINCIDPDTGESMTLSFKQHNQRMLGDQINLMTKFQYSFFPFLFSFSISHIILYLF